MESAALSIAALSYIWPMLITTACLIWKREKLTRKAFFWFASVLLGYLLMFGVPYMLLRYWARHEGVEASMELVRPYVHYYWTGLVTVAMAFFLSPLLSTYGLYRMLSTKTPYLAEQARLRRTSRPGLRS